MGVGEDRASGHRLSQGRRDGAISPLARRAGTTGRWCELAPAQVLVVRGAVQCACVWCVYVQYNECVVHFFL